MKAKAYYTNGYTQTVLITIKWRHRKRIKQLVAENGRAGVSTHDVFIIRDSQMPLITLKKSNFTHFVVKPITTS